jgi:uncharacterized protein YciI
VFIVLLHYVQSSEVIEKHIEAHRAFIDRNLQAGHFIASGPQVPRTGGVILANASSKEALGALLHDDPLLREHAAEHHVIEFNATRFAPGLQAVLGSKG